MPALFNKLKNGIVINHFEALNNYNTLKTKGYNRSTNRGE